MAAHLGRVSEAGACRRVPARACELVLTRWVVRTEQEAAVEPVVKKKAEGEWSDEEEEEEDEDEQAKIAKLR